MFAVQALLLHASSARHRVSAVASLTRGGTSVNVTRSDASSMAIAPRSRQGQIVISPQQRVAVSAMPHVRSD
jgi:hypothetical protein